jgi:hypothetical protein
LRLFGALVREDDILPYDGAGVCLVHWHGRMISSPTMVLAFIVNLMFTDKRLFSSNP